MTFYDDIAGEYEEITGGAERGEPARRFVASLRERFQINSAAEAACGTGLYSVALAQAGVRVVGADISEGMLAKAKHRADQAGVAVQWVTASMQEMADRIPGPFDAVLCMGNSVPHLLTEADLDAATASFARMLAPRGVVVLHVLNYTRVLARGERIVGIDRQGERIHVRFYDLGESVVRFNILSIDPSCDEVAHALHTTTLRPWRQEDLAASTARAGLEEIRAHANLQWAPFDEQRSDTLLLTARAP